MSKHVSQIQVGNTLYNLNTKPNCWGFTFGNNLLVQPASFLAIFERKKNIPEASSHLSGLPKKSNTTNVKVGTFNWVINHQSKINWSNEGGSVDTGQGQGCLCIFVFYIFTTTLVHSALGSTRLQLRLKIKLNEEIQDDNRKPALGSAVQWDTMIQSLLMVAMHWLMSY